MRFNISPVKLLPLALVALAFVVTGCPHNDYTVELKPQGAVMERTVTFFKADGTGSNGVPNYQAFNQQELALIAGLYPTNGLTNDGEQHIVRGQFTSAMPGDVGGAGVYTNLTTSLGAAGFYAERFRGNDDLAGMSEKRLAAAGQLTDLVVGWSEKELGRENGYGQLHQFLDVDFRRDLKNLSAYWWEGQMINAYKTNASEEFIVRFAQYLQERGYFKLGEIPKVVGEFSRNDSSALFSRMQRLVAGKMGVPESAPVPAALAFLADDQLMEKSFTNYLASTDGYRARLKQWEEDVKSNPDAKRPDPWVVAEEPATMLLAFEFNLLGATPDHLAVKLSLPAAPLHSNGRWDESIKQEVWETDIEGRTNATSPPFSCYASWVQADAAFQTEHLGKVAVSGDELVQYSLWRSGLEAKQGVEWDAFLARLQPGEALVGKIDAFRFSGEEVTNSIVSNSSASARDLLKGALK